MASRGYSTEGLPVLALSSTNGTFERKEIPVPFFPNVTVLRRQTTEENTPMSINGIFDSKVMSRLHAEIWADQNGKVWIRDTKSSNGTFVNGSRLSQENQESEPHPLELYDHLELGIDIVPDDQPMIVLHKKVSARVEGIGSDRGHRL
ncbi:hypothetical protein GQ53DRAFT_752406 [Thozetella sp. PMI_491]|nr:hypothetical protein GQ53DRAFT_752406 [Thozetella sp. PMI_491]